jgi:hypothetical protein
LTGCFLKRFVCKQNIFNVSIDYNYAFGKIYSISLDFYLTILCNTIKPARIGLLMLPLHDANKFNKLLSFSNHHQRTWSNIRGFRVWPSCLPKWTSQFYFHCNAHANVLLGKKIYSWCRLFMDIQKKCSLYCKNILFLKKVYQFFLKFMRISRNVRVRIICLHWE